jgi:hypothetical protein
LLFLFFSAVIATRLGALVKSVSAKGSNKALLFKNIDFMVVCGLKHPKKTIIIVNMNLKHVKNKEKDGKL